MYAKLEEEYGLAKRAMSIYERATQVVNDEDKFEVITFSRRPRPWVLNFAIDVYYLHRESYGKLRATSH